MAGEREVRDDLRWRSAVQPECWLRVGAGSNSGSVGAGTMSATCSTTLSFVAICCPPKCRGPSSYLIQGVVGQDFFLATERKFGDLAPAAHFRACMSCRNRPDLPALAQFISADRPPQMNDLRASCRLLVSLLPKKGACVRFALASVLAASVAVASPAHATWHEAKSKHFIIYGDVEAGELASFAKKLERFDHAVRVARGMDDAPLSDSNRLTIYFLKSPDQLAELNGSGWSALLGIYMPRASGSRAFVTKNKAKLNGDIDSDIVFFHEYAHHLMLQASTAALPSWLVEGFAEFLSTAKIGEDGSIRLGAAANHRAAGVLSVHHELPLTMMLRETYDGLSGWQNELRYSRGWLLTHYLTFEASRRGQLERYVAAIQSGVKPIDSALAAFGDLKQLDRELDRYATRKQLSSLVVQADDANTPAATIREMTAAEAALMPVRLRSEYGVNRRTSGAVAARARKLAAAYPNDPFAQVTLAEAEYDAKNYEEADAAASRALAADPQNVRALLYKGRAQMKLAKTNRESADWNRVRSWFLRANKVDTEYAEPLALYYESFNEAGQQPTQNAVKGLLYAVVLAPQDNTLRLRAVRQLVTENRFAEAKTMLAPIANLPHGGKRVREAVIKIMTAIGAADSKAAIALIDKEREEEEKDS